MTPSRKDTHMNNSCMKVSDGSKTSSLDFSKQELTDIADYLRYAHEQLSEYAHETAQRYGRTFPMASTLREYADRAETYRRRVQALIP